MRHNLISIAIATSIVLSACQTEYDYTSEIPFMVTVSEVPEEMVISAVDQYYNKENAYNKKTDYQYSNRIYSVVNKSKSSISVKSENSSAFSQATGYVKNRFYTIVSPDGVYLYLKVTFVQNEDSVLKAEVNLEEAARVQSDGFFKMAGYEINYIKRWAEGKNTRLDVQNLVSRKCRSTEFGLAHVDPNTCKKYKGKFVPN
jgi:hypothetical protein